MGRRRTPIVGTPAAEYIQLTEEILKAIQGGTEPLQIQLHSHPGGRAQLRVEGLLGGLILQNMTEQSLSISALPPLLHRLPRRLRLRWGVESASGKLVTYRQVEHLFTRVRGKLNTETKGTVDTFDKFVTLCLEAQVDASGVKLSRNAALDGTVIQTFARLRFRKRPKHERIVNGKKKKKSKWIAYSADPDAWYGHYPAKHGRKSGLAMGYEAHLLTQLVLDDEPNLTLVSGMVFRPNRMRERPAIRNLVLDRKERYDNVIYDAGYHFIEDRAFSLLDENGIGRYYEPNSGARKLRPFRGALLIDGDVFHPSLPEGLRDLPAKLDKGRSAPEAEALNAKYREREKYRYRRHQTTDKYYRAINPAHDGLIACSKVPASMQIGYDKPRCGHVPGTPHDCPTERTINVPKELLAPARQAVPFGTPKWLKMYGKGRSQIEGANSLIRHNYTSLAERKWCFVIGRVATGLMFLAKVLACNALVLLEHRMRQTEP